MVYDVLLSLIHQFTEPLFQLIPVGLCVLKWLYNQVYKLSSLRIMYISHQTVSRQTLNLTVEAPVE